MDYKPNVADVEHGGKSFQVYYSMSPSEFLILVQTWIELNLEFTADNLSKWLLQYITNHSRRDTDMSYWYIMPVEGNYFLYPFIVP